ncbi:MAG: hypothetical protein ACOCXA_02985 [Planctomycetota bacterium]
MQIRTARLQPLDEQHIHCDGASSILVADAEGRRYHQADDGSTSFRVSGTLGHHVVRALDADGRELATGSFRVQARSRIRDAGGVYGRMFDTIHHVLEQAYAERRLRSFDGERSIRKQCITSRGTWTGAQGGRYFFDHIQDSTDYFAAHQREDGMVWDFGMPVDPEQPYHFEWRWDPQFSKRINRGCEIFGRQPIMNDVEHQYINGLYLAWQVSGDDAWMAEKLDGALRAVDYLCSSPYTWSDEQQLIHRPYCLDLWDFQSDFDAALVGGDAMDADPERSKYGIFFGDNLSLAQACIHLSEMLQRSGREADAERMRRFADGLIERTNALAWNGSFYQHHVTEHPDFIRDFGFDDTQVVSLSNAMVANYGIDHDKSVAIIRSYQRIREEMPEQCRAEFMTMYPPYHKGFHIMPWVYVNGAMAGLVAGELARASFAHGLPQYGADVLRRYWELVEPYAPYIEGGMLGKQLDPPQRELRPIDLRNVANADLTTDGTRNGWFAETGNDFRNLPTGRQTFQTIDFDILDPAANDGRACLRLGRGRDGFAERVEVPISARAACIYFLHAAGGGGNVAGEVEVRYRDGSSARQYVVKGKQVLGTWNPSDPRPRRSIPQVALGWVGPTEVFWRVGLTIWGWNNPHPEREIDRLVLHASQEPAKWGVVAISRSDQPAWMPPKDVFEGPNQYWSASCVAAAMGEGLAGIRDRDRNLQVVQIAPGWLGADVPEADACLKYEDGGGYVRYQYRREPRSLHLLIAGNSDDRLIDLLLPEGVAPVSCTQDGEAAPFEIISIESSRYARIHSSGIAARELILSW